MTAVGTGSTRRLGSAGPAVFPLALGCMGMYGAADERESVATTLKGASDDGRQGQGGIGHRELD